MLATSLVPHVQMTTVYPIARSPHVYNNLEWLFVGTPPRLHHNREDRLPALSIRNSRSKDATLYNHCTHYEDCFHHDSSYNTILPRPCKCKLPAPLIRINHTMKTVFSTIIVVTVMIFSTTVTLTIPLLLALNAVIQILLWLWRAHCKLTESSIRNNHQM